MPSPRPHDPGSVPEWIHPNASPVIDQLAERIADRLADQLGDRLAELLTDRGDAALLDASEVARQLGRSRDWVYQHAAELGAIALGDGERPRLSFDSKKVAAYLDACETGRRTGQAAKPGPERNPHRRRRRSNGQGADLLPIRGEVPRS